MAPITLRSRRQSAKNDSELIPLLRDGSEPPQKKSTGVAGNRATGRLRPEQLSSLDETGAKGPGHVGN